MGFAFCLKVTLDYNIVYDLEELVYPYSDIGHHTTSTTKYQ